MVYYHPHNLLEGLRGSVPAGQLHQAKIQDWLGSAVFVLNKLLSYKQEWMVVGDFIDQYAAKCAGRKLSPWSTDSTYHLNRFIPTKKFRLFIVTERPYTPTECLDTVRNALFHSHPGLQRVCPGETEYSVRVYFDNGLGDTYVTVRFISMTTPVFDTDLLALTSRGFDIYDPAEYIPMLVGRKISPFMCTMYKPIVIERLIENICCDMANIIAVPHLGEENARQRRYISRQLLRVIETEKQLINPPYLEAECTKEDTCTICHEGFTEIDSAKRLCVQCGYLVHKKCAFEYIQSRLETYTYITCLTCRQQLPLWRGIIMNKDDIEWGGCYTETTSSESGSSEAGSFLESADEIEETDVEYTESLPDLEPDTDSE